MATPYSGVRFEWAVITADASAPHGWSDVPSRSGSSGAIDLPLSLTLDTAFLPVTLVVWLITPSEEDAADEGTPAGS